MDKFFDGLILQDIVNKNYKLLANTDRHILRSIKANLRRNHRLKDDVNSKNISISRLLNMSYEEMADDLIKRKREVEKKENLHSTIYKHTKISKEEIEIIINKIEDP